jgi:hypothetical protein
MLMDFSLRDFVQSLRWFVLMHQVELPASVLQAVGGETPMTDEQFEAVAEAMDRVSERDLKVLLDVLAQKPKQSYGAMTAREISCALFSFDGHFAGERKSSHGSFPSGIR